MCDTAGTTTRRWALLTAFGMNLECFALSKHTTAYQHRENDLNNQFKNKDSERPANTNSVNLKFLLGDKHNQKLKVGGGGLRHLASLKIRSLLRERRRTTLSDEGQTQLPTIPPAVRG